jgi:hypothetical protein
MKQHLVNLSIRNILKAFRIMLRGNKADKRRLKLELARISASLFGDHYIGEDYKLWRQDQDFIDIYNRLMPYNPYSQDRKFTLREFIRYTTDIDGVLAECGCHIGTSAYYMANSAPNTPLYLFDSFAGLSPPGPEDKPEPGSYIWKQGDLSTPESVLRHNLIEFSNIHILKGWIPERFSEVRNNTFRLVHIDVDLYKPTLECLRFFYPRLAVGGIIVLDDYGFTTCPGAHRAATEYMTDKIEHIIHLPTGQGIIIRQTELTE